MEPPPLVQMPFIQNFSLHSATRSGAFGLLSELVSLGGDIRIRNIYRETAEDLIRRSPLFSSNPGLDFLVRNAEEESEIRRQENQPKVWTELPMKSCIRKRKWKLLGFLSFVGGQWGACDEAGTRTLNYLMDTLNDDPEVLSNLNLITRWLILGASDQVLIVYLDLGRSCSTM